MEATFTDIFNPGCTDFESVSTTLNIQDAAIKYKQTKDSRTFGEIVECIEPKLRQYVCEIVKDDDAASDVLVITFENVFTNIDMFDPSKAQFTTWLYRIARNNAFKSLRKITGEGDRLERHYDKVDVDIADMYGTMSKNVSTTLFADDEIFDWVREGYYVRNTDGDYVKTYDLVPYTKEKVLLDMHDASIDSIEDLPDLTRDIMKDRFIYKKKIKDISEENHINISLIRNRIIAGKNSIKEIIKKKHPDLYDLFTAMKLETED